MALPIHLITVNASTGKIVNPSTLREPAYSARPGIVDNRQVVLGLSFVDASGTAVAMGATDTFQFAGDIDFEHVNDTGAANAGYSGAVVSIVVKNLTSTTIPATGFITLTNGAGQNDRIAYTAKSGTVPGNITFTVSATLTYTYLANDVITVEDELMLWSDVDQVDIPGDWSEIDRATGKISVRVNANTDAFTRKLGSDTSAKLYLELLRISLGDPSPATAMIDYGYALPSVIAGEGEPGSTAPSYYTAAESDALYLHVANQTIAAEDVDFDGRQVQVKTITADTTLTTSNSEADVTKHVIVVITASGATRNLTLPAAWKWLGTRPTSNIIAIPDGYLAMIDLLSVGTTIFASGGIADSAAAYLPLLLGLTTGNMYSGSVLPDFQHFGTGLSSSSQAQLQGSADAIGPRVILSKTRGTTAASKTVVQASDSLGMVQWEGADGTNFVAAAYVKGIVDGTPGTNDMPGAVLIGTTADGASAVTDRVKITNAGDVQLLTNDRYIYLRGSESVNDSIRMSYQSGTDVILFESRDSGSWVPKHTWSMA